MAETKNLDRVLERLRSRMTRLVWTHGLSTVVGSAAAILLLAFLVDWSLHVPRGVRWIHLAALAAIPVWLAIRALVRPLRARPDVTECAVLVERAHPELKELFVTAAEIRGGEHPKQDGEVAERLLAEAESAASRIDASTALDPSGPRLRFLVGALSTTICGAVLVSGGESTRIFFSRLFGGDADWPKRTHLAIEIPSAGAALAEVVGPEGSLEVRVARGADVPVVVRAEGTVPDEVTLHLSGSQPAVIAPSGGGVFRTLLRSVQEDVSMYATGGDDQDEEPSVRLIVLRPPDVVGLALEIEPPAYSGLGPKTVTGGDAEILAGTKVVVHVLPDPREATGKARLLPEDRLVDLAPAPFPASTTPNAVAPTAGNPEQGLAFTVAPEKSLRYRVELVDHSRLSNPDPGLFAITVIEDRPPEVEILSPGRGDYDTVPGGSLRLSARARDDFGVESMKLTASPIGAAPGGAPTPIEIPWEIVPREESAEVDRKIEADRETKSDHLADSAAVAEGDRAPSKPSTSANGSGGSSRGDSASPRTESGALRPEPGSPSQRSDAGSLRSDAGSLRSDAGSLRSDSGSLRSDLGSLRSDAGSLRSEISSQRSGRTFRSTARARARLDVAALSGSPDVAPGSQIEVAVIATDNHQPVAHEGRSAALHVRIVSPDEYLRRLQDRLGRARSTAAALSELQRGKLRRTEELIAGLESDELLAADSGDEIFTAATGERRVEGDARALARELCSALEGVLYARIDDRAGPLLEKIDAKLATSDRIFDPAIWHDASIEERAASGTPGGLADRLLAIAGVALEVSETAAPAATAALARAQQTKDLSKIHTELSAASDAEKAVVERIERLLEMLAEWDNYQSVLSLTHDILNGQKNLKERTKAFAKDH